MTTVELLPTLPPLCRYCGMRLEAHSAIDGACSDDDGPHVDSELDERDES